MKETIAFIGLGSMGTPMLRNLLESDYQLHIYNRTQDKLVEFKETRAKCFSSVKEAVSGADIVITMLSNDDALHTVSYGDDGILSHLKEKGIHISMSTVSPKIIEQLHTEHLARNQKLLSAPVFGRPEAAAAKKLWIVTSGDKGVKDQAKEIFQLMGQGIHDFGEHISSANFVKIAGNFLILSMVEGFAESLNLLEKNNISKDSFVEFITSTLFNAPIYQNYGKLIAQRKYEPAGFKLELGLKDVNLMHEVSEHSRVPMPIVDILHSRFLTSLAKNRGHLDWSAIELTAAENAGNK